MTSVVTNWGVVMSSWAAGAEVRILHLKHELNRIADTPRAVPARISEARKTLQEADHWLKPWPYVRGVIGGSGPERVWGRIHEVEDLIDSMNDHSLDLHDRAKEHARAELPREAARLEREYQEAAPFERDEVARHTIQRAHEAAANKWATQRNQQRGIVVVSILLTLMAALAVALQTLSADPFLPPPDETQTNATVTLALVMGFGALGGILSGFIALYLGQSKLDNTRWLDIKPTLVLAKAATGIWIAVIGAAAVGTELLVGNYTSIAALVLLSVVFGYSQQAVTKFLDRKAEALLEDEPSKSNSVMPALIQ